MTASLPEKGLQLGLEPGEHVGLELYNRQPVALQDHLPKPPDQALVKGARGLALSVAILAAIGSMGCRAVETEFEFTVTISEIVGTVVTVDWISPRPCAGFIDYGLGEPYPWRSPVETGSAEEHRSVLVGLRPETTYPFRIVCVTESGLELTSPEHSVTTGFLPSSVPDFAVSPEAPGPASAPFLAPTLGFLDPSRPGPPIVLLDREGQAVWYFELPPAMQASRARISIDSSGVLFNPMPDNLGQGGADTFVRRVAWDGTWLEDRSIPFMHHDFVELPDGTIAALARLGEELGPGEFVSWDQIVEVSPDGTTDVIFSGADPEIQEALALDWASSTTGEPQQAGSFHSIPTSNTLHYVPSQDAYYINAEYGGLGFGTPSGNQRAVIRFDRGNREVSWVIGGPTSSFESGGDGQLPWVVQHGLDVTDEGIVVFANNTRDEDCSALIEVRLDMDSMSVTPTWTHRPEPCQFIPALGTVDRLTNGNTVGFWSLRGTISEVTPEGNILFEVVVPFGQGIGYGETLESFRTP